MSFIKINLTKTRLVFFGVLLINFYYSQNRKLDSLKKIFPEVHDTLKSQILCKISRIYVGNNPDTTMLIADSAIRFAKRINYTNGLAVAYAEMGHAYNGKGKFDESLKYYILSLQLFEKLNNKRGLANQYNNLGNAYNGIGNKDKAFESFTKGYEYAVKEPRDNYMVAITSVGVGNILLDRQKLGEAIDYYLRAREAFNKIGSKMEEGVALTMLGETSLQKKDLIKAEDYFLSALAIFKEVNDDYGLASTLGMIGNLYEAKHEPEKAIKYNSEALAIHEKRKALLDIWHTSAKLAQLYKDKKDFTNAFKYQEKVLQFKDSVINIERQKSMHDIEAKYETEKKEQALVVKSLELDKSQIQVKQRTTLVYIFIGAMIVFCVLLFFVFRSYNEKKKANKLLEQQYTEIKEKSNQIEHQKNIIEVKNKDITDSINYSKFIQQAILPSESAIKKSLPNSYCIFKPKDIISGDFYFIENAPDRTYFAVVDCTGHGVPGAMLSVFAQNTLKKIITTHTAMPNEVLSEICKEFKANLHSGDGQNDAINDGLDIGLACIDKNSNKLYFSGAKNSLILVRNNELTELKADRWGISGKNEQQQLHFTNHELRLQKGDKIYLYSDGIIDQFGGPSGKKFKYKQLQQLLLNTSKLMLEEQKKHIESVFESWKGSLEQLDDVTLMCVSL